MDKTIPIGKAPILSDADLDDMAEITDEDIAEASEFWEEHAPAEFESLIEAEPEEPK